MKRILLTYLALVIYISTSLASEKTSVTTEKKFDAGEMITEHISDSHDWHIIGEGEDAISIPLPIIVYSKAKGFDCFLSSRFEHGHTTYKGYKLEENKIAAAEEVGVEEENTIEGAKNSSSNDIYDFSITKNVLTVFFIVTLMLWMFISVANSYKKSPGQAPKGLQSFIEPLIIFIRDDVAKTSIGEKNYMRFMPYLLTVFFFILIGNLLGLIPFMPGGANLTGNIAITMSLAVITFLITLVNGKKDYWRHIFAMPGVPVGILVLLTPIEIMGMFLRPFVLMIRLFANITAGHIIALSFFSLIFIFGEMNQGLGIGVSVVSVAFTVFMGMMELLVAFLQAYVFTLLSAIYFGSAVEEHHHAEEHH